MIIKVATAVGTQDLWKQERILLYISAADKVKFYTDLEGSALSPIATYTPPSSGDLYIDVTDYVRANPSVEHLYIVDVGNNTTYDTEVEVKGLNNPRTALIPPFDSSLYLYFIPPTKFIEPFNSEMQIGVYPKPVNDGSVFTIEKTTPPYSETAEDGMSLPGYVSGFFSLVRTKDGESTTIQNYRPTKRRCDVEYAMVRWESFTGAIRCHAFEVTKQKSSTAGAYSLLPLDNEYVEIKGRVDGFTLRIDGLNRYDLWYYADILNSSKVEVALDGGLFERVQVVTKTITLPDGECGTNGKLEIEVNYKRYDAVAM